MSMLPSSVRVTAIKSQTDTATEQLVMQPAIESAVARQDQHTVFRELRTCKLGLNNQSTTVQAEEGTRLTNMKD